MILHYKFEYNSNNSLLIHSLQECLSEFNIEYKLTKENNEVNLYIKDTIERMEEFSNILSQKVPMSIFLHKVEASSVDNFPEVNSSALVDFHSLTFCMDCLNKVEKDDNNSYNPFVYCKKCGQDLGTKTLKLFINETEVLKESYEEYFKEVTKLLIDNKKVKIKTLSGDFVFFKIDENMQEDTCGLSLLSTDLNELSKAVIASKQEVIALASIEKPIIKLELNNDFKQLIKNDFLDVRYVNDMFLYLLSKELQQNSIYFLGYKQNISYDAYLTFEPTKEYKKIEIPKISIAQNGRVLILDSTSYESKYDDVYEQFNEKDKAQFMVLLSENNLLDYSVANFYVSSTNCDGASVYSHTFDGILDIYNIKVPQNANEIFEEIKKSDTGLRLIGNFQQKFPKLYTNALKSNIELKDINSMSALWQWVALILGFEDDMMLLANSCAASKGPRIEYSLIKSDKMFNKEFNAIKLIQSGISFKLAGLDSSMIALGYVESFCDFMTNCIDKINEDVSLDAVSFCGDLISQKIISKSIHKNISNNFKVYYNKDFPIQKS